MIYILLLFVLFLIGIPICFSLGLVSLGGIVAGGYPLTVVIQRLFTGADSTALIAIPLFILAGGLMVQGGISKRIVCLLYTSPDDFVAGIHQAARAEKPDALVIGEVWEDGSTKVAYGVRRKHILGGHCDGLMNYPLRNAILAFFRGGGGEHFVSAMETIRENYPPSAFYSAMNSLGTHDTPRILTLLGAGGEYRDQSRDWRAHFRLSPKQRRRGKDLLRPAALLLFCFPGSPTCLLYTSRCV